MDEENDELKILSFIFGWIYFFAWSISFYGQLYENYRRKSVSGLSFDFINYNLTGFLCYTIYNVCGFINKELGTGPIEIQDIVFASHALIITFIIITQMVIYYDKSDEQQTVSNPSRTLVICIWWGYFIMILFEKILKLYDPTKETIFKFNSVIYLGFSKVLTSLIKYVPQAFLNYQRKSTVGWSILSVILDLTGGIFSLGQNIIDFIIGSSHGNKNPSLNMAKFALSFISIFFDVLFIVQHYCLYPKKKPRQLGEDPRLHYLTTELSELEDERSRN